MLSWLLEKAYWRVYHMRVTSQESAMFQVMMLVKIMEWKEKLNA